MHEFFSSSVYFGVLISLAAYFLGAWLRKKTGFPLFHPILVSVCLVIALLSILKIDYAVYNQSAKLLSALLTPATICLAVPLYEQLSLLKKHRNAILIGIFSGVITSLLCVLALCMLFKLDHAAYVTLLPKSVTSAIGMGISEELGGYVSITVAVIILSGILGNMTAKSICRIFGITDPVARGIAIGTSSHAIGTTRAMEMGEIEGAMSGLSIVISGILTVAGASVFSVFL